MLASRLDCALSINKFIQVATYEFTKPIQVLLNASKVFKNLDKKKEVETDLLSCLAPLIPIVHMFVLHKFPHFSYF